jgi:hypothetical protein
MVGMNNDMYARLTEEDRRAIIYAAIRACRWIGWMGSRCDDIRPIEAVRELKEEIERRTGLEIEEYT